MFNMTAVAQQIDNIKILSAQLYSQDSALQKEHKRLKTFNQIIVRANEATTQKELVQGILEACIDFVNFDIGGIYLIRDNKADIVATKFIPPHAIETLNQICIKRPELRELFQFGKPLYLINYDQLYPETSSMLGGIKSLISVPVLYNNKVKGCINIGAFNNIDITTDECDILRTLGKHLGHVLHRFEIEQELETKNFDLAAHIEELRASNDSLLASMQSLETSQQQLDIERENFRTLFNKMTDMIFVVGLEGSILAINDAVRHRLGYPNGNLVGQPITIVYEVGECSSIIQVLTEMIRDERHHCMTKLVTREGEVVRVDSRVVKGLWNGKEVFYHVAREVV